MYMLHITHDCERLPWHRLRAESQVRLHASPLDAKGAQLIKRLDHCFVVVLCRSSRSYTMSLVKAEGKGPRKMCTFQKVELLRSETLGIGSYGKVCKAKCDNLVCAAKIMHTTFFGTTDPGARMFVEKFEQECEFVLYVTHPNIVQCLGIFHDASGPQQVPVLLLELMDESLTHFLDRSKEPLSYFTEVTISHDVALALAFLHSNGYIHRDLSSNNILLIAGSRAKVADFGMCRLSGSTAKMMTTCPGTVVYMPPEALREPPRYTDKIDTFSFGVVVVQILTRLFPNPEPSREVIDEVTERIVLETKRRENHIKLVKPNHPLLPIALDCLKNSDSERPTASKLCDMLETLKQAPSFVQNDTTNVKPSIDKQQQKSPDNSVSRRENDLVEQIRKLKQQLDRQFIHKEGNSPQEEEEDYELDRQVTTNDVLDLERPDDWNLKAKSRSRKNSTEEENLDQWKRPQLRKKSASYEEWKSVDSTVNPAYLSYKFQPAKHSNTTARQSWDKIASPLSSSESSPNTERRTLSYSTSDSALPRTPATDVYDDLVDPTKYLRERQTGSDAASSKNRGYYNTAPKAQMKHPVYVGQTAQSKAWPAATPAQYNEADEDNYEIPDNDPSSPAYAKMYPDTVQPISTLTPEENEPEYMYMASNVTYRAYKPGH